MNASVVIVSSVKERVFEFYRNASLRHNLLVENEVEKVIADMMSLGDTVLVTRKPIVSKWIRMELQQINSTRTAWRYGVKISEEDGHRSIYVVEAEHQQNMTDKSITMQ